MISFNGPDTLPGHLSLFKCLCVGFFVCSECMHAFDCVSLPMTVCHIGETEKVKGPEMWGQ